MVLNPDFTGVIQKSAETCDRTNILAYNIFETPPLIGFKKLGCHIFVCTLVSIWLLHTTKIIGLEKFLEFDQH